MSKTVVHFSKTFLNKDGHESDASILSQIKFYYDDGLGHEATIKIRDCRESIMLYFGVAPNTNEDDNSLDNSIYKVNILISELEAFKAGLIRANDIYNERLKKLKDD